MHAALSICWDRANKTAQMTINIRVIATLELSATDGFDFSSGMEGLVHGRRATPTLPVNSAQFDSAVQRRVDDHGSGELHVHSYRLTKPPVAALMCTISPRIPVFGTPRDTA